MASKTNKNDKDDLLPLSQLVGVKTEFIKIDQGRLQEFMNGCFPKDPNRCVVEVQFGQMF